MRTPIDFTLSGTDDNGIERFFKINASDVGFQCQLLKTNSMTDLEPVNFNLQEGCQFLRAYNNNFGGGLFYQQRDFFKPFYKKNLTTTQENLIRAFAVSSGYIQFWYTNELLNQPSMLDFYDDFPEALSDKILFDWTGTLDIQPQMYFLPIELIENSSNKEMRKKSLEELYNLRLIQKYNCNFAQKTFTNYYVPFLLPDTNGIIERFQLLDSFTLWKQIVKGINKEIARVVRHNKKRK